MKVVYACESGSRAWGFASPDSDYDIRFLFRHPRSEYLRVLAPRDTIEMSIKDDLDPGGWDVRKAAGLMRRSNGALLEWLHSPIVYREEEGFLERWRRAASASLLPRSLADHYRGLAKQMWVVKLQRDQIRAKDYLYALRALACCRWTLDREEIPPVAFEEAQECLPDDIQCLIPSLLEWKASSGEGTAMERMADLDEFIPRELEHLIAKIEARPKEVVEGKVLDELYRTELGLDRMLKPDGRFLRRSDFTVPRVQQAEFLLFDAVAGSHAYGTAIEGSDEDRRGVFAAPPSFLLGLEGIDQVSDEKSDLVYYELGRFVDLLLKNNPNALEVLAMPEDCIRYKHPAFDLLDPALFLSKLCGQTFGGYAMGQIRKARGLNKKIVNPQPEKRKSLAEFCFVLEGQGTRPLEDWLTERGYRSRDCGLVAARHAPNVYAIFHDPAGDQEFRGMISPKGESALVCSSVPLDAEPVGWMTCNQDAFKAHVKSHREYWEWVELRNEERYRTNAGHGRGYDSKNLMHTLRLLDMAEEMATEGVLRVRRPNREFLLRVRRGEFPYEDLVQRAEEQLQRVEEAFDRSDLPAQPDSGEVERRLLEIRSELS